MKFRKLVDFDEIVLRKINFHLSVDIDRNSEIVEEFSFFYYYKLTSKLSFSLFVFSSARFHLIDFSLRFQSHARLLVNRFLLSFLSLLNWNISIFPGLVVGLMLFWFIVWRSNRYIIKHVKTGMRK